MARGEAQRLAELLGASALALGHPLLDVFGRSTETFVFRGVDGRGYVLFALTVVLIPPLLLWLGGRLVGRHRPTTRERVHIATMAALSGIAALVAVRWLTDLRGGTAAVAALAVAVVVVLAYRHRAVPTFFAYLAVLPPIAVLAFLTDAPASSLLRGGAVEVVTGQTDEPVVMIVLDEFPTATLLDDDGGVDPVRFPSLARLATEGTWYRNHTTLSASTVRAVPTILTGNIPERDQEPLWSDRPDNLFTLLGGSHEMRVRETVTQLCPRSLCADTAELTRTRAPEPSGLSGLSRDALGVLSQLIDPRASPRAAIDAFEEDVVRLDAVAQATAASEEAVVQPSRFADFFADLVAADEPVLHFLHLVLPHGPWRFTATGAEYEAPEIDPPGQISGVWTDEWPASLTRLRHELQARYTDLLIGQVIGRLETSGLWDTATIVVVADHGGSFTAGEQGRAITEGNAPEVMWAPLFIRSPGLRPGPTDVNAQATDVLPTVAELVGVANPNETDGRPLVRRSADGLVPTDGAGGRSGIKQYARFTNAFQPEPDAVLDIDVDRELPRVLAAGRAVTRAEADHPIGAFLRSTPHGDLYGERVAGLDLGPPLSSPVRIDQLRDLERGGGGGQEPMYLSGTVGGRDRSADDPWVVLAVDGRVAGLSPTFRSATDARAIATIVDPALLAPGARDVRAYVVTRPGGRLRPVPLS